MKLASRSRPLPVATRAAAVAAVAAFAVLAPIRMAQGSPKTRFAVVPAGVTSVAATDGASAPRVAAAAVGAPAAVATAPTGPAIPPAPRPVLDSPLPLSHLGA